jgi:hypothetical protein
MIVFGIDFGLAAALLCTAFIGVLMGLLTSSIIRDELHNQIFREEEER